MPRLAKPGEADAIRSLVRDSYAHYVPRLGIEPLPMVDDYARRIEAGQAWVLDGPDGIIGVLVLEETAEGLLLDNVAVRRDLAGRGHGRALVAFAEAEARRRGHRRLRLYTNEKMTENIALYTRLGFAETRRASLSGRNAVFMEKVL